MTNLREAKKYCKQYGATMPKAWKGYKLIWHPWHQPADRLLLPMTYKQYVERVIEIGTEKPQHERKERLRLMKPVMTVKAYAAWVKAYAAREKAYAARERAYAAWEKAYAALDKANAAWEKANAAWRTKNHDKIMAAHAVECPNCKWDGNCLPQFD